MLKMHENMITLHVTKVKMQNKTSKKTQKDRNNPESSHPYTQRQLVLERKLKTTCPQVHQSTPTAHSGYIFLSKTEVMHFVSVQKIRIYTQLQINHQVEKIQSPHKRII